MKNSVHNHNECLMAVLNCNRGSGGERQSSVRRIMPVILSVVATIIICVHAPAVAPQGRREIVSDDFTRPRPTPTPKPPRPTMTARPSRPPTARPPVVQPASNSKLYRLASSSSSPKQPLSAAADIEQLGITLWRLRSAKASDTGQRMVIREKDTSSEWIPERIEVDTPLHEGDRVRLSIESPREGYLYIVDRDLFADGTMGDAMLIFPTLSMRGGDNHVRPGKLIDIPAQEDDPNYFKARWGRSDQMGELLTIIVTTTPLDLRIGTEPLHISAADIAKWEKQWASATERFEMEGGAGQAWTKEEKEASAAKGTRQLTRDEPSPQTIYRIATTNKTAFLVNVQLSYGSRAEHHRLEQGAPVESLWNNSCNR